jgi:cold shock CspA family protein
MGIFDRISKIGQPLVQDTPESVKKEKAAKDKRIQGKIIRVDPRGFGFITTNEMPFERIFWHWTSLTQDTLKFPAIKRGMKVEFVPRHQGKDELGKDRGFKAIRIEIIDQNIDLTDMDDDDESNESQS